MPPAAACSGRHSEKALHQLSQERRRRDVWFKGIHPQPVPTDHRFEGRRTGDGKTSILRWVMLWRMTGPANGSTYNFSREDRRAAAHSISASGPTLDQRRQPKAPENGPVIDPPQQPRALPIDAAGRHPPQVDSCPAAARRRIALRTTLFSRSAPTCKRAAEHSQDREGCRAWRRVPSAPR